MVHREAGFILPLMHHFVQQCRDGLVPAMILDMPPADDDLGAEFRLAAQRIVSEPALHSPRNTNRNIGKLAAEFGSVELPMRARQVANVSRVRRMCSMLDDCDPLWRIELKRELLLEKGP